MDRKNRWFYNLFFPKYAKKAYQIITISNFCKQDIALTYKIDLKDIHVVYANANIIGEILDEDIKNSIKKQYANGFDYFFFVGSLLPRKNLTNQILAFLKFKEKTNSNYKLLISGNSLWGANEILKTIQENNFNNDIIFLGRLKDTELKNVLGAAFALCYASKFEGFGIPIVESFLSGVPVITSNTSSMPEIANNAAVLVNPDNIDDIAEAMNLLYIDDSLRKELILKGLVRAKDFSWTNNAQSFSKIISSS
jgi:glycosyltransferase involved in cell wall biosynthesis